MTGPDADKGYDELLREISSRHGVSVSRDDPIMILHTLNEYLVARNQANNLELTRELNSQLEIMRQQWVDAAHSSLDKTLEKAIFASQSEIQKVVDDVKNAVGLAISQEVDACIKKLPNRLNKEIEDIRLVARLNFIACCMVCIASGLAVWASS